MNDLQFRAIIYDYFHQSGRSFPWRIAYDPYHILVSEFMLQQTQTDRVMPLFNQWIHTFPTLQRLAAASLGQVLTHWQGLGYNRRAKFLHLASQQIVNLHHGQVPCTETALVALPGIGKYTAAAIQAFAFNLPSIVIETNIRAVFIHHYFYDQENVTDKELLPFIERTLDRAQPRIWYSALMDYGAHLKKITPNPSRRSRHYTKQSTFKGSDRQIRGQIIKLLSQHTQLSAQELYRHVGEDQSPRVLRLADKLASEGLIKKQKDTYFLP